MKPIRVGLLGLGTVGSSVINLLDVNRQDIAARIGREIIVRQICVKDVDKPRDCDLSTIELTQDISKVVNNPEIDVVVEAVGGIDIKVAIKQAIEKSKPVVTANKALIALCGNELFKLARTYEVAVMFEAAVAGGIPIIKTFREGLSSNRIEWFAGIINGTTNYILSEMCAKGLTFDQALAQAQCLGYAESDPSFDIAGVDAGHKLAILSAIAFGMPLSFEHIYIEGIQVIQSYDIKLANKLGYTIKSLAIARRHPDTDLNKVILRVHPVMLPKTHLMAQVNGVMNAIYIMTNSVGPILFYGAGAGGSATASSIVADIIDVARTVDTPVNHRVPHLGFVPSETNSVAIGSITQVEMGYYIRISALDKLGTLANLTQIFADVKISIESIIQQKEELSQGIVPIVILTHSTREDKMNKAIQLIQKLPVVKGDVIRIRLEGLENKS